MKRITPLLTFLVILVFSGCSGQGSPEKPDDLIPEDQYIDLLIEMQHIQSYRNAEPDSVNADSLKEVVFNSYNVTDSQFLATHKYYQLQPDLHLRQIDSVLKKLDNQELRIRAFIDSIQSLRQKRDSLQTPDSLDQQNS
jgi:hypothetical protein